jgi:hypothetical protein
MGWISLLFAVAVIYPTVTGTLMVIVRPDWFPWILGAALVDLVLILFVGYMALGSVA